LKFAFFRKRKAKCFKKLSVEEKLRIVSWQEEAVLIAVIANRLSLHHSSPEVRETLAKMCTQAMSLVYLRHLSNSMSSRMMDVTKIHVDMPKN
jgi:IS30 family transposase